MAVAYASVNSTNFLTTQASSITITKPTGLAAGDLLIAFLGKTDTVNPTTSDIDTPAGWTSVGNQKFDSNEVELKIVYKIADSADAAASNFSFTSDEACHLGGVLVRVTGEGGSNPFAASEFDLENSAATAKTYTAASTPATANSLIMAVYMGINIPTLTIGTYISTPSITWTEAAEIQNDSANKDPGLAVAYGTYTGTSQFTQYGATFSGAATTAAALLIITPQVDGNADVSHLAVTPTLNGLTATHGGGADVSHLAVPPTLNSLPTTNTSDLPQWTNSDKNSATWTNPNK